MRNTNVQTDGRFFTGNQVRIRYGDISDVTLWRWVKSKKFPAPDKTINRRNYWWEATLQKFDEAGAA